jgi:hypothetical protein
MMFQFSNIQAKKLSEIPSGEEMFADMPSNAQNMTCHNICLIDGNPLLNGYTKSIQISRWLQPKLLMAVGLAVAQGSGSVTLERFGIRQFIPLELSALRL